METTALSKQIVKIDPKEFGVEESKATQIAEQFKPMLDKMIELESEFNEVVALDINDPMTTLKAKEVRLKYVKVRTGTAAIHKIQKDFYLQAGRFIDGWKNAQLFASQGIEEKLQAIEFHYENQEKERILKLNNERLALLLPYSFDGSAMNLGTMDHGVWDNFLVGTKLAFEAKQVEEKRLQEEKIAKEKAEKEEKERVIAENLKLKAEAEEKEKALELERIKAKKEADLKEALRLVEQKKADMLLETQRKESEAKLKKEREEKEKLQAELKDKQEQERKAEAQKQAEVKAKELADRKAAAAPDKEKMLKSVNGLILELSSADFNNQSIAIEINTKFASFKKWATEQINTL